VAQVAGEGPLYLSHHILRVVAQEDGRFTVRGKRCHHEGSCLTTPSGRPGLRVYHLEHSRGRLEVQVTLGAALSLKRPGLGHRVVFVENDGSEQSPGTFFEPLADEFAPDSDALQAEIVGAISVLQSAFDQFSKIRRVGRYVADLELLPWDAVLFC
jgi:hypothetical protein